MYPNGLPAMRIFPFCTEKASRASPTPSGSVTHTHPARSRPLKSSVRGSRLHEPAASARVSAAKRNRILIVIVSFSEVEGSFRQPVLFDMTQNLLAQGSWA